MVELGLTAGTNISDLRSLSLDQIAALRFDEKVIVEAFESLYTRFNRIQHTDPRTAPSLGAGRIKYEVWMHNTTYVHLDCCTTQRYIQALMRLRLVSCFLRCDDHTAPRADRICLLCRCNQIEDEKHVMLECPRYTRIRRMAIFTPLYRNCRGDMNAFINQKDQFKISHLVYTILKRREELMDQLRLGHHMFDSSDEDEEPDVVAVASR